MLYLVFALLFSLLIAVMGMAHGETVTVNYLVGQANLSLIVPAPGFSLCGRPDLGLFQSLSRYPHSHEVSGSTPNEEELRHRVKTLEQEKNKLEIELARRQAQLEAAVGKQQTEGLQVNSELS